MKKWNGIERRSSNSWNELIIRIDANLINLIEKTEEHFIEDINYQLSNNRKIEGLTKYMWIASGVTVASLFFIKFLFKT